MTVSRSPETDGDASVHVRSVARFSHVPSAPLVTVPLTREARAEYRLKFDFGLIQSPTSFSVLLIVVAEMSPPLVSRYCAVAVVPVTKLRASWLSILTVFDATAISLKTSAR